jgi:glycosyltransferase involved in cell wall biosynthesis
MSQARGLKLLMTADAVGGVWQYAIELAAALRPHGVRTVLALLGPAPSPEQRAQAKAVPGLALVETGLPLDWLSDGPAPVLAAGAAIADLARKERVDLVHLNMPTLAAAAPPGVPVIAVTHGCVATWWQAAKPGEPLDRAYRWHRALMAEGLRAADLVVAPTASYSRTVARHYGLPQAPAVVHNGRTPLAAPEAPPCHDCVLTVGRLWDRVKRADLLDQVAARLPVPFHAAGALRGPHGETAALEHLHLLGQVDCATLARHLAARPVFVSAACFEPFGLSVLEAAEAGCALVLSDIAPFRELWDGAAVFVAEDDARAYTHAIESVLGDAAFRLRLGDAARARAARYTPDAMADGMLRLYAQLLSTAGIKAA